MATNKDASAQDGSTPEDTPQNGPCGDNEDRKETECGGDETEALDPITAAVDLLRIAEDPSLSLRDRFRQVDKAADELLASFPGPRKKPDAEEGAAEEIGDQAYDATSEESAAEYVESLVTQAKDVIEIGLDKIVEGLSVPTGVLPEEAIRQAQRHRELMIPRLIRILEEAAAKAAELDLDENNAHFFALFLLAEFEAEEAFPAIRKILSLPDDLPYSLFGDVITENLPDILAPLIADRPEVLEEMIVDVSLDASVRAGIGSTITSLVAADRLPWANAVRMLGRGIAEDAKDNGAEAFDYLCDPLEDILPSEVIDKIDETLLPEDSGQTERIMGIIEEAVADPKMRRDPDPFIPEPLPGIEDTLEELRSWACFRQEDDEELSDEEREEAATIERLFRQHMAMLEESDSPPAPHFLQDREETVPVLQPIVSQFPRTGRNQPCPCGSGKKYKKCCGASG